MCVGTSHSTHLVTLWHSILVATHTHMRTRTHTTHTHTTHTQTHTHTHAVSHFLTSFSFRSRICSPWTWDPARTFDVSAIFCEHKQFISYPPLVQKWYFPQISSAQMHHHNTSIYLNAEVSAFNSVVSSSYINTSFDTLNALIINTLHASCILCIGVALVSSCCGYFTVSLCRDC